MEQNTLEITERSEVFEFTSLREMVNQALQLNFGEIEMINGITSGFKDLDNVIHGFKKGELATIAVRPGMGKTALMLSITNNIAIKNNHSLALFSAERSKSKITNRLIESETGMSLNKLTNGKLKASQKDHMHALVNNIAKANIYLDDTSGISVEEIAQKAKQLKVSHNIEVIVIDYLELLTVTSENDETRQEQLSKIAASLKNLAHELNLPILLFSQIPGHYTGNIMQRPSIIDLPVYITELSDVVLTLHRSDIYSNGNGSSGVDKKGIVELIVGKYENKKEEKIVELRFIDSLAKFTDK